MPHKTMDDQARAAYEDQSVQLRAELKKWEGDWATANGGKKPGRGDIKQNPDIAHKYKHYNKLRDILAGKIPPPPPGPANAANAAHAAHATHGHQQQRKRTQSDAALPPQTPSKRSKPAQTPQKTRHSHAPEHMPPGAQTPAAMHSISTPSLERTVLTPVAAVPTSIGPTPQKDGRVLGIFDLLGRTPSRSTNSATTSLPAATPSKHRTISTLPPTTTITTTPTTARFASTPQSKRTNTAATQLLFPTSSTTPRQNRTRAATATTPFKTPSTNRTSNKPTTAATPTSSTPSFLRRRTAPTSTTTRTAAAAAAGGGLARVEEQDENGGGGDDEARAHDDEWKRLGPLRLPRKLAVGRGLSSVVAGLRRMEEEAFGEEEEVLREMEMEMGMDHHRGVGSGGRGIGVDGAEEGNAVEGKAVGAVGEASLGQLGRDLPGKGETQKAGGAGEEELPGGLLSGFDNEALYDSLDDERQGQRQPLRQFKKRGQKRTTRLVNMRPTRAKRPAPATGGEADEDDETVHETQPNTSNPPTGGDGLRLSDFDSASEIDFDISEDDEQQDEKTAKSKKTTKKKKATAAITKDDAQKSEGVVKRAVRKVKATAHANFKRLKLRNTGSKGGPGYNSRFRRKR